MARETPVAIIPPMFTANMYLSKYRNVIFDSRICSAPSTAILDSTAPAPIALRIIKKFDEQSIDRDTYMTINVVMIQAIQFLQFGVESVEHVIFKTYC